MFSHQIIGPRPTQLETENQVQVKGQRHVELQLGRQTMKAKKVRESKVIDSHKRRRTKGKEWRSWVTANTGQRDAQKSKQKHLREWKGVGGRIFITVQPAYLAQTWDKFCSVSSSRSHQNWNYLDGETKELLPLKKKKKKNIKNCDKKNLSQCGYHESSNAMENESQTFVLRCKYTSYTSTDGVSRTST